MAAVPEFAAKIEKNDPNFVQSEFWRLIRWLKDVKDDLYDPTYTDVLRVAFTYQFGRGKLQELVALLSGLNFENRQYEEAVAEESFKKLKDGIIAFMNQTHFERLIMILRSAGFITSDLITSHNAVNFAYILYLRARKEGLPSDEIEQLVRRSYVMSILSDRYMGSIETVFDRDIRQIVNQGVRGYVNSTIAMELSDNFWADRLPQLLETTSTQSPYFVAYLAAQAKLGDRGFLSSHITVRQTANL
jgi:hypothetical protein